MLDYNIGYLWTMQFVSIFDKNFPNTGDRIRFKSFKINHSDTLIGVVNRKYYFSVCDFL